MNKVLVKGRIGNEPTFTTLTSGTDVTNFVLIHNWFFYNKDGQKVERKITYQCSIMGNGAKSAFQYIWKGREMVLEGKLRANEWGYPEIWVGNDGVSRTAFKLNVEEWSYCGSSKDRPASGVQHSEDEIDQMFVSGQKPAATPAPQAEATVQPVQQQQQQPQVTAQALAPEDFPF